MLTQSVFVPAGTISAPIAVNPLVSVCVGPQVLGGSVLVECSRDGRTGWTPWTYGTITQGGTLLSAINGWIRVTATGQQASVFLADMTQSNTPFVDQIAMFTAPMTIANATTEQVLGALSIPPRFLNPQFRLDIALAVSMTNSATVKTLRVRVGGLSGTVLFLSPSLASFANYNALATIIGRGDGFSLLGAGPGASGGIGGSVTAYTTAQLQYLLAGTEITITGQKATGTDLMVLESAFFALY